MNGTVRVRPEAELDLLTAAAWYEAQRAALGQDHVTAVAAALATLEESALIFAEALPNIRRRLNSPP